MIISITGASGFIGRVLALRHIAQGDEVRVLTRKEPQKLALPKSVRIFQGDLAAGTDSLTEFIDGSDILYHCAGEVRDPGLMRAVHVTGTRNLLGAAAHRIGRWVQLSSVGAYGPHREGIVSEKTPLNPLGEYELTKVESDRLVTEAAEENGFSYAILRPSIVFGPGMPNRSLYQLIAMIDRGLFFFIGAPGAAANYIYVDNVVDALLLCGYDPAARGRIYDLSDHASMEDFIAMISDSLGRPHPKLRLPLAPALCVARTVGRLSGFPLTESRVHALTNRSVYATARIARELGYSHEVSMREGLRRTVDAWRKPPLQSPS